MQVKEYKINIPKASYDLLIDAYGSEERVTSMLSFYFDTKLRQKRKFIENLDEMGKEVEVKFYVYDFLDHLMPDLCAEKGKTLKELLVKEIPRLCRRKKLR